jgi:hypothetical protein
MDLLFAFAIVLVFGFVVGWRYREFVAELKIKHLLESVEEHTRDVVRIRIERMDGMIYIYNMETNEFMAQGETRNVVERNLKKRFPDTVFAATDENLREVFANDSI